MVVVLAGWGSGYLTWTANDQDSYRSGTDLFLPAMILVSGMPTVVVAGRLLASSRKRRLLGSFALTSITVALAYLVSFSFFGGFCLDPGDVCVTSWSSRLLTLAAALACLGVGWLVQRHSDSDLETLRRDL
jgi:hypothetical protein